MRNATISRVTKETQIEISIELDGTGKSEIDTGIGFFDHMLASFAKHGLFDISIKAKGDLKVDTHHTVEDTGIVLGSAIDKALGDRAGISRFGFSAVPMDEALVTAAADMSGRPFLVWNVKPESERVGDLETETVREFFMAMCNSAHMTLHINEAYGGNTHHVLEATFKSASRAIRQAVTKDARVEGILSTKGTL